VPPHYDAYPRVVAPDVLILERYRADTRAVIPLTRLSGFLDDGFSCLAQHDADGLCPRHPQTILKEVRLPVTRRDWQTRPSSPKLATDAAKGVGFIEVPAGREKDFLNDRPVRELSGIAKNRQRSAAALGALTFGHVANCRPCCSSKSSAFGGNSFGYFQTGNGMNRSCWKSKTGRQFPSSTTLPRTNTITRRR